MDDTVHSSFFEAPKMFDWFEAEEDQYYTRLNRIHNLLKELHTELDKPYA